MLNEMNNLEERRIFEDKMIHNHNILREEYYAQRALQNLKYFENVQDFSDHC
jgi:hypothetical protein